MRTASSTISPTCPQNTRHHRLHHIPAPGRHATAASGTARRCRGTPAAAECGRSPAGPSALSARCARSASRRRPSGAGAPCEHRRLRLVPPSGSQLGHYRHGAAHVQRAGVGSPLEPRKGWCRGSACAPPAAVRMRRRCLRTCSGRACNSRTPPPLNLGRRRSSSPAANPGSSEIWASADCWRRQQRGRHGSRCQCSCSTP